jgi:hypothetical protein
MGKNEKRIKKATASKTSENIKHPVKRQNTPEGKEQYGQSVEPLMPELDELVKKNPNRLIGCGG